MPRITVFTPTFNRKNKLKIAFASLLKQTTHDFVWLIIDDGSTDGTDQLIAKFQEEADFQIIYKWKENGGRHTAVNYSYDFLQTEYVVTLDSDDELLPDAIEKMLKTWDSIPQNQYNRFWCISGREQYADTGEMVGKPYPQNINDLQGREQRKLILKCPGEKHCCRKVEIHKQYKFPVYPDTKFVTENIVWERINRKYDQYCVNDCYGLYHTESTDSLSQNSPHKQTKFRSAYYRSLFYVNELFDEFYFNKSVVICLIDLPRCAMKTSTKYSDVMNQLISPLRRMLVTLCYPIAWVLIHYRGK